MRTRTRRRKRITSRPPPLPLPTRGRGKELFRIRLVLGPRPVESRQRHAGGVHRNDFGKLVQWNLEPPRVVDLRHQAEVGDRHRFAAGIWPGLEQRFERLEAGDHPMMVPGIDRALLLVQLVLQVAQRAGIVERMDVAGDEVGERARLGAPDRILGQQRRLGMRLIEIFDDGERLQQMLAAWRHQHRHAHLRIDGAEFRPLVVAAVLDQVNRRRLIAYALEIERDAHTKRRRRAEVGIKFHASSKSSRSIASVSFADSATSSADRSVSCLSARLNASRSAGVSISVSLSVKSSACGATSSYIARPAAVSERKDSRMSARLARRTRSLRCSMSATARDTLVLCIWVWAPMALPVMTPYWPSVTSTRHSGTPMP